MSPDKSSDQDLDLLERKVEANAHTLSAGESLCGYKAGLPVLVALCFWHSDNPVDTEKG